MKNKGNIFSQCLSRNNLINMFNKNANEWKIKIYDFSVPAVSTFALLTWRCDAIPRVPRPSPGSTAPQGNCVMIKLLIQRSCDGWFWDGVEFLYGNFATSEPEAEKKNIILSQMLCRGKLTLSKDWKREKFILGKQNHFRVARQKESVHQRQSVMERSPDDICSSLSTSVNFWC